MTASWEMRERKPFLTIAMCETGMVPTEFAMALMHLRQPPRTVFSLTRGSPWDVARSTMFEQALKNGSEWVLSLDSDIIVRPETLERLLSWNLPVVSGTYFRRYPRRGASAGQEWHVAAWRLIPKGLKVKCPTCGHERTTLEGKYTPLPSPLPENQLIEVDVTGCGCLLIHRRVLEKIKERFPRPDTETYPFAEWTQGTYKMGVSEDFNFLEKVKDAGFKVFLDTGCKVDHVVGPGSVKLVWPGKLVGTVV